MYPEGILYPRYNGIRTFKRGAFSLAYECNVPVIPYVIRYVEPEGLEGADIPPEKGDAAVYFGSGISGY